MASLDKDHPDSSLQCSAGHKEYAVTDVIITSRLRDRELLRKRRAEAQEKQSMQWVLREQRKNKRQRRGRGARQRQGHQPVVEPSLEPELEPEPEPQHDAQEEAEPEPCKQAPPEPAHQDQPHMLTVEALISAMPQGAAEGELAASSQDPTGEDEVLNPAEAEIPEALNTPLENERQDNE